MKKQKKYTLDEARVILKKEFEDKKQSINRDMKHCNEHYRIQRIEFDTQAKKLEERENTIFFEKLKEILNGINI